MHHEVFCLHSYIMSCVNENMCVCVHVYIFSVISLHWLHCGGILAGAYSGGAGASSSPCFGEDHLSEEIRPLILCVHFANTPPFYFSQLNCSLHYNMQMWRNVLRANICKDILSQMMLDAEVFLCVLKCFSGNFVSCHSCSAFCGL